MSCTRSPEESRSLILLLTILLCVWWTKGKSCRPPATSCSYCHLKVSWVQCLLCNVWFHSSRCLLAIFIFRERKKYNTRKTTIAMVYIRKCEFRTFTPDANSFFDSNTATANAKCGARKPGPRTYLWICVFWSFSCGSPKMGRHAIQIIEDDERVEVYRLSWQTVYAEIVRMTIRQFECHDFHSSFQRLFRAWIQSPISALRAF